MPTPHAPATTGGSPLAAGQLDDGRVGDGLVGEVDVARLIREHRPTDLVTALDAGGSPTELPACLAALSRVSDEPAAGTGSLAHVHPDDRLTVTDTFVKVAIARTGSREVTVRLVDHSTGLAAARTVLFADLLSDPEVGAVVVRTRTVPGAAPERVSERDNEPRWRRAAKSITFLIDGGGLIVDVLGPIEEDLGWTIADAVGRRARAFVHPDEQMESVSAILEVMRDPETTAVVRHRLLRRDGSYAWYEGELRAETTDHPDVRFAAECRDIAEQVELQQRLVWQAGHDLLTGLLNRRELMARLADLLADARNHGRVAAVFIDLDDFKDVNDSLGHEVGDLYIVELSRRLSAELRPGDLLGRLGGDEFLLVCPDVDSAEMAGRIAARVNRCLSEPIELHGVRLQATASVGVAMHDGTGDASLLLRDADTAMYEAKRRGRNRTVHFDAELREALLARVTLLAELRDALATDDQLQVCYHTIRDATDETIIRGVEALVRWNHPRLGVLSPDVFLPVAAHARILHELDHWVLRRAMRDTKPLIEQYDVDPFFRLGVNLSGATLSRSDCVELVLDEIAEAGFDPRRLVIEVTESEVIESLSKAEQTMAQIRHQGVKIALDDFGVGYSSLTYLRRLTAQYLKLDHTFVRELTTDPNVEFIIGAVVAMATHLGISVVAEGIETVEQLELARQLGVASVQGYRWGAPVAVEELPFGPRSG